MAFISFYYWMNPYYEFYKNDIKELQARNPMVMYDGIEPALAALKQAGKGLGRTESEFKKSSSEVGLKDFFEDECEGTRLSK
jgi:hypothetical protein